MVGWVTFHGIALVLGFAFLGGWLAQKLRQPTVGGYLLGGLVAGALGSRVLPLKEVIIPLNEIGISLLLFVLGIELAWNRPAIDSAAHGGRARLRKIRELVFWGGTVQILLIILLALLILPRFGFDFYSSLFIGCALSLSSGMIVVKFLSEKGEAAMLSGQIMSGWLLTQGLAVLPMVIILPTIWAGEIGWSLLLILFKATGFLLLILIFSQRLAPILMKQIARLGSRELLLLAAGIICLLAFFLTVSLDLPLGLAAFLAGLVVARVSEGDPRFPETQGLRNFLTIGFLASLGVLLQPAFLPERALLILLAVGLVVLGKLFTVGFLVFYLGFHIKTAIVTGMGLAQAGEWAFILGEFGLSQNLVDEEGYLMILSVIISSLLLSPWLFQGAPKVYHWYQRMSQQRWLKINKLFPRHAFVSEVPSLVDHIVICGYDQTSSWFCRALELLRIPFVVIDTHHQPLKRLERQGISVIYGDPAELAVLRQARVGRAKAVVMVALDRSTQELVITHCQTLNPSVKLVALTYSPKDRARLKALGVMTAVQPEFEAARAIVYQVAPFFDISSEEVARKVKRISLARYLF